MKNTAEQSTKSFELPARYRLYTEVLASTMRAVDIFFAADRDEAERLRPGGPSEVNTVEFPDYLNRRPIRYPLELPSLGSDGANLVGLYFGRRAGQHVEEPENAETHDYIMAGLTLFADGSPFIAEGDDVEGSFYLLIVGRELDPFIVQSNNPAEGFVTAWDETSPAARHSLTDMECGSLIDFIDQHSTNPSNIG